MAFVMVRNLLRMLPMGMCAGSLCLAGAGCVVPVPQDNPASGGEPDAPPKDADPVIADSNPTMPGPLGGFPLVTDQQFRVTLRDADIGDTLYLRVFRNYDLGNPGPIAEQMITNDPLHGTEERTASIDSNIFCASITPGTFSGAQLIIDVMVADRPYSQDINAMPQYRVVTDGGKGNIRSWVVKCPVQ